MATAAETRTPTPTLTSSPVQDGICDAPYLITSDMFQDMIEKGVFPRESRVFLWNGRLYEKMAKSRAHAGVQASFLGSVARRLPPDQFIAAENPVRLDDRHLPLPDLVVAKGNALEIHRSRYPDARDVVLVVEVAVSSLPEDLGIRLSRYALTLPDAAYVVADVKNHQLILFTRPRADPETGRGGYETRTVVKPGEALRLRLDGRDLDPIPYEEVMY